MSISRSGVTGTNFFRLGTLTFTAAVVAVLPDWWTAFTVIL